MRIALWVAAGSGLGGAARTGLAVLFSFVTGAGFPCGTLAANLLGSFAIGLVWTLTLAEGRLPWSPAARQFFLAGFCGGFTTFSLFSLQTLIFIQDGELLLAGLYSAGTITAALVAVWAGFALGARLNRRHSASSGGGA